jgi:hypothetical protein
METVIPGPVETSVKLPYVTASVSVSQLEVATASEIAADLANATDELDVAIGATESSALVHIDLQPSAEVIRVTFQERQSNFTCDKPAGSLNVTIPIPVADGILQIFYYLAGGLNIEPSPANATDVTAQGSAWVRGYVYMDSTNWKAPVEGIKVELHKNN